MEPRTTPLRLPLSRRRKLAYAALACALLLGIGEGILRLSGFAPDAEREIIHRKIEENPRYRWHPDGGFYTLTPGYVGRENGIDYRINRLGLRDDEITPRTPATWRLLVLGDSVTVGGRVPREANYVERLERDMAARYPDRTVEVVNAGINGFGVDEYPRFLAWILPRVEPDAALLLVCLNDIPHAGPRRGIKRLLARSAWYHFARRTRDALFPAEEAHYPEVEEGNPRRHRIIGRPSGFAHFAATTREFVDLCGREGIPVALATAPLRWQLVEPDPDLTSQRFLDRFCREEGIPYLDLQPVFRAEREPERFLPGDDLHFSEAGHSLAAREIGRFLASIGFLPAEGRERR